ncbi:uncharacterized protein LOC131240366 [Magnolia sinica]|uniref:uncharacterized protein LOC131240366 n=1 Tax=Magnolia sinica TaxID=86752 RepID=UPI00265A19A4|nr:uncharacterized protein LOC131240366 [Magnolia sinica]
MANVTRPSRRLRDEDSGSSKKKQIGGKLKDGKSLPASGSTTMTSGLRRSSRETPSKKKRSSSPSTTRKSERLEKRNPLAPVKRKLERGEKQKMPSSPRRSERGEKNRSLSSSSLKKSERGSSSLNPKKKKQKKEENVKPAQLETKEQCKAKKKVAVVVLKKKKRLDARAYRLSFNVQTKKAKQSDLGENQGREDTSSQRDSTKTGTRGSKKVEEGMHECNVKKGDEPTSKYLGEGGEEAMEGSSSGSEKLADGILRDGDGKAKISQLSKKRKFSLVIEKSKCGDNSLLPKCSVGSLQSSPDRVTTKEETSDEADGPESESVSTEDPPEAINDAGMVELDCSARGGLPSRAYDVDLEPACEAGASKRKRNALELDSDISVTKTKGICSPGASSVDLNASSPSGSKINKLVKRCMACFKQQSVDCDSENQEVCSCNATASHDLCDNPLSEDRGKLEGSDNIGTIEECGINARQKDFSLDTQTDIDRDACVICKCGGELVCCAGKGCSRSYHLSCHDPPVEDVPLGIWHCLHCVKKKMEFGVHSMSEGLESIWDAREAEASDCDGMQKEKQYFVKYKGLAHVHNRWIPESQLLHEAPQLITKYNKRLQKEQVVRWKTEWTLPQRLVQKRLVMTAKQADEYFDECCRDVSSCFYEWFVKWKGLGYEHATWELENASFLNLPEAKMLMRDYESRRERAKKTSSPSRADQVLKERKVSLSKLPKVLSEFAAGLDNDHLHSVNKLREYWHKYQNAIVIDEQERIMKVILFIISIQSYICRPFLIISTSSSIPAWEDELLHLAPSFNFVVYSGNKDVRKCIRSLEFYENGGCVMFQVLLSHPDAVVEDLEVLNCLGWEAIIVDECQLPTVSKHFEKIGTLISDFRLLLISGQMKDSIPEYRKFLAFLDSRGSGVCGDSLKNDSNDSTGELAALKDRFSRYLLYERKSDSSKFVEYWVPVRLSMVQLEQYCATLLANSISLCSCSKTDPVGALRDILISTRKCCDHPYLVDPSLQIVLTKGHAEVEYLDIGVNASGKLQLLDKILPDIKNRGLRVLILFQSIGGSGRNSIGDILDDYMRQRFGPDSYERIDSGLVSSRRQAALSMFNNKERGRFVFLIENRACHPSIKLSSVDTIIIFDSDWNPSNDLRALQKINFDSQFKQLKVFRLYSSYTVEEKVLIFAKQDVTFDSNIQNINRSTSHMLLIWGAAYLFNRLDEFHHGHRPCLGSNTSSEQSLLNDVVSELLAQLPHEVKNNDTSNCSIILKAKQSGAAYSRNISLLGELELQLTDEEQPHAFWKKLLEGRIPKWRYLTGSSQRARKRVQYFDDLPEKPGAGNDEVRKKRKKVASLDSLSPQPWVEDQRKEVASGEETRPADVSTTSNQSCFISLKKSQNCPSELNKESGASGSQTDYGSHYLSRSLPNMNHPAHGSRIPPVSPKIVESPEVNMVESEGRRKLRDEQKSLHFLLKPEISKLCETLQLPEDVKHMARRFLEYIMNNHRVIREPETILKAFQISLCWAAASFLKHKVDHKESLALVKQLLKFECKEEEAEQVYMKLRKLKKKILPQMSSGKSNMSNSQGQSSTPRNDDVARHPFHTKTLGSMASHQKGVEGEAHAISPSSNLFKQQLSVEEAPYHELGNAGINEQYRNMHPPHLGENGSQGTEFTKKCIRRIEKVCGMRTKEILSKQQEEIAEFKKFWDMEREKLNKARLLESDHVRAMHKGHSVKSDKLKKIDDNFAREMDKLSKCMDYYQRILVEMQREARNREKRIKARWLEDAKSGRLSESFFNLPLSESGLRLKRMETWQRSMVRDGSGKLMSGPSSVRHNVNDVVSEPVKLAAVSRISAEAPVVLTALSGMSAEAPVIVQNEVAGRMPPQNEVAGSMPPGTITLAEHSSSMNVVSNGIDSGRDDNVALEGGEATTVQQHCRAYDSNGAHSVSSPQLCQAELPYLDQPCTSPDHDNSDGGVVQHSRVYNSVDACPISSQHSRGELLPLDQPQVSPGHDNSGAAGVSADNYDFANLIASPQQNRIELPSLDHSSMSPGHPNSWPSYQVPSVDHNQPSISSRGEQEHVPSCEGQNSPHQIEVSPPQTADPASPLVEQCNDSVSVLQPVVRLQLPTSTDVPLTEQIQPDASAANGSEREPRHEGLHSSQQTEVALQQPDEALHPQTDQFSRLVAQSVTQLPIYPDLPYGGMPVLDPRVAGMPLESTIRPPHSFPMTTQRSQVLYLDPLQNELSRLRREEEQTVKMHEDVNNRLKADCERELEEVRRKYNGLVQNSDKIFAERMKKLETYMYKVSMNQRLAEAFRLKCIDVKLRSMQPSRVLPSTSGIQQFPMQSSPQTAQRPLHPSAPPVQVVHRPSALFSSNSATAPHFSPTVSPRVNIQLSTELRAPAPHLQPFRPTSVSMSSHLPPTSGMPSQQSIANSVTAPPQPPQLPHVPQSVPSGVFSGTHLRDSSGALPAFHNSLSAVELLMDFDRRSGANLQNLSDLSLSFDTLLPSNPSTGSGRGTAGASTARPQAAVDIVCLSDDD